MITIEQYIFWQGTRPATTGGTLSQLWASQGITNPLADENLRANAQAALDNEARKEKLFPLNYKAPWDGFVFPAISAPVTPVAAPTSGITTIPEQISSTGNWLGSKAAYIIDALSKAYRVLVSPSKGYCTAAVFGEAKMNFNDHGGEVVGGYFVAEGTGETEHSVNDVVGVSATAYKSTNCWAAGLHADVYDTAPGGTAIGVNIEFPVTHPDSDTIGINIQPNSAAKITGLNLQGQYSAAIGGYGAKIDKLITINSTSPMWKGSGDTGGGLGQHVGKIKIAIDGTDYFIPVYQ